MSGQREAARGLEAAGGGRRGDGAGSNRHADCNASAAGRQGPSHGRFVAGGSVWAKTVRASVHMLRRPVPSWAVDKDDALAAWAAGVTWLRIDDAETQRRYWVTLATLLHDGALFDRGFGPQLALPLTAWHVGETAPKPLSVQLGLFEGVGP